MGIILICSTFLFIAQASALPSLSFGDNLLEFRNKETVFNQDGTEKNFSIDPGNYEFEVGDILVGVIDLQTITNIAGGDPTFESSSAQRISGVFAQEVAYIDAVNDMIFLKAASRSSFTDLNGNTFDTGLAAGEMIALYDRTINTDFYIGSGTVSGDVNTSKDGEKWLTFGYDTGANLGSGGGVADGDEDGYAYSQGVFGLGVDPQNLDLQFWGGLNVMYSASSGYVFPGSNDPTEILSLGWFGYDIITDAYLTSHIYGDNAWVNGQYDVTPWVFSSDDPAHINVVPEPTTITLFGVSLLCLAGAVRRKQN